MKTTKIGFQTKIVSWLAVPGVIICLFFSCDTLEPDADILKPAVSIAGDPVFVMSNNSAFIDLKSKIQTNQPVRISITSPTKYGVLSDLGRGLLQYTPSVGKRSASDAFEFTILSENDQTVAVDTVWIKIENDSTDLPCGIFPTDDYIYGVKANVPVVVSVLTNDYTCGVDSADLVVSIYRPDDTFPPHFGHAVVSGHAVVYTAGSGFDDADKVIYKVHPREDPENATFGAMYIAGEEPCVFSLKDDSLAFDLDSLVHGVRIPVLKNDSLCATGSYQINIALPPQYGDATVKDQSVFYQLADVQTIAPFERDFFLYEVCVDAVCRRARVDLRVRENIDSCLFDAIRDTVDLSGNSIPLIYLDVLYNDSICGGYSKFTITAPPHHGAASFSELMEAISYERDFSVRRNDSLEYEICNSERCSRAKVYIKNE